MASILVRNLEQSTVEQLKAKAALHHHSLQSEVKLILERAAGEHTLSEVKELALKFRKKLKGKKYSDSVKLLREDRNR